MIRRKSEERLALVTAVWIALAIVSSLTSGCGTEAVVELKITGEISDEDRGQIEAMHARAIVLARAVYSRTIWIDARNRADSQCPKYSGDCVHAKDHVLWSYSSPGYAYAGCLGYSLAMLTCRSCTQTELNIRGGSIRTAGLEERERQDRE
jgi:hypothetical protein